MIPRGLQPTSTSAPADPKTEGRAVSQSTAEPENTEKSRTQNSLPLSTQSWCKQPCCRELVPVSGQDRAHRRHSGTAHRLLPLPPLTRTSEQENPTSPIMDCTT